MERGVSIVRVIWVLQTCWIVLDDSLEEVGVFEVDGSANTNGGFDPLLGKLVMMIRYCRLGRLTWLLHIVLFESCHGANKFACP